MSTNEENDDQMAIIVEPPTQDPNLQDSSDDEDVDPDLGVPINDFVPSIFNGLLPAPKGDIARCIHNTTTKDMQRQKANDGYAFLCDPNADLGMLNNDTDKYTALVAVPGTHKVKLVYGLGIGTARIGHTSPVANKLLTLYGEGGPLIGAPATLMFETNLRASTAV